MEAKDYIDAMHTMDEFRNLAAYVLPDKYKLVCMKHGIDEREAMDMYSYLQMMKKGLYGICRNKPIEYLENVITMAKESYSYYMDYDSVGKLINFGNEDYDGHYTKILVIFEKEGKISSHEFDLNSQGTYVLIAGFISNGYHMLGVIRQSDSVDGKNFVGDDAQSNHLNGKTQNIPIYDGDVMLCYISTPEFWGSDWQNCGLYVCYEGSYHRLVYTPGKGYVRRGEVDMDEDFELNIDKNAFTNYIMTIGQKWYKIGNVHVDISFLVEKKQ